MTEVIPSVRRAVLALAAFLAWATVGSARADAQSLEAPRGRQGTYRTLGAVVYGAQQWGDGRYEGFSPGYLGYLRVGELIAARWGLGTHFESGIGGSNGQTRKTAGAGIDAQFNPVGNLAIWVGLGLGYDSVEDPKNLEHPSRTGFGSVFQIGTSWDIFVTHRLSGGIAIAPTVLARYLPNDSVEGYWVGGGFQVSWWSGRPRNQLILPDNEAYKNEPTNW